MRGPRWWTVWIGLWVRVYPAAFRRRFAADLQSQYPPPDRHALRAGVRAAVDLVHAGVGARLDDRRRHSGSRRDEWSVDLRMAWRRVTRRPALSVAIIVTFGLVSGVSSAVFATADTALLRPLPYADESALVSIGSIWTDAPHSNVSTVEFLDYRHRAQSFASLALHFPTSLNLSASGGPAERIQALRATPSLFDVLGVRPRIGRTFTDDDQHEPVAVISDGLWRRRFGGSETAIGSVLETDGAAVRVLGVMPPSFIYPTATVDVWLPLTINLASPGDRGAHNRQAVGRLRTGATIDGANTEMRAIARALQLENPSHYPAGSGWSAGVMPLRERLLGDTSSLWVLSAGALAVLILGCANVTSLFMARAVSHAAEWLTLLTLGAPPRRLRARAWREGAILGMAGGVVATAVGSWLFGELRTWLPAGIPRPDTLFTDPRSVGLAMGVTTGAGAISAWLASLRASRFAAGGAGSSRVTQGRQIHRQRSVLVGVQVTVAVALLVSVGYSLRSYRALLETPLGMDTDRVATARVSLSPERYRTADAVETFGMRWLEGAATHPGVEVAGLASMLPLTGQSNDWNFGVEGYVQPAGAPSPNAQARVVTGSYFDALKIPLVAGRVFRESDHGGAPRVAVVSQELARRYWGETDPIGRRIRRWAIDSDEPWTTVVGVVGDVRFEGPMREFAPALYFPLSQLPTSNLSVFARLRDDSSRAQAGPAVLSLLLQRIDPQQPLWAPRMLNEWRDQVVAGARLTLALLGVFAATSVLLAMVGLHGVISAAVATRTKELGLRVALGARPASLMRTVIARSVALTITGVAAGIVVAALLGRQLAAVFPGVVIVDIVVWTSVGTLLLVLAGVAAFVPARRAMRADPITALRAD